MARNRLRDLPDMAETYAVPHDHRAYGHGHHLRVEQTIAVGTWLANWKGCRRGADLSCGNAKIADGISVHAGTQFVLGDYAAGEGYAFTGPIEETIELIQPTELFLNCETLEHLVDPDLVLRRIRHKANLLILSTPVDNWGDPNTEHLWEWDKAGVQDLLVETGWNVLHYTSSDTRPLDGVYTYGIWACEAA